MSMKIKNSKLAFYTRQIITGFTLTKILLWLDFGIESSLPIQSQATVSIRDLLGEVLIKEKRLFTSSVFLISILNQVGN